MLSSMLALCLGSFNYGKDSGKVMRTAFAALPRIVSDKNYRRKVEAEAIQNSPMYNERFGGDGAFLDAVTGGLTTDTQKFYGKDKVSDYSLFLLKNSDRVGILARWEAMKAITERNEGENDDSYLGQG